MLCLIKVNNNTIELTVHPSCISIGESTVFLLSFCFLPFVFFISLYFYWSINCFFCLSVSFNLFSLSLCISIGQLTVSSVFLFPSICFLYLSVYLLVNQMCFFCLSLSFISLSYLTRLFWRQKLSLLTFQKSKNKIKMSPFFYYFCMTKQKLIQGTKQLCLFFSTRQTDRVKPGLISQQFPSLQCPLKMITYLSAKVKTFWSQIMRNLKNTQVWNCENVMNCFLRQN